MLCACVDLQAASACFDSPCSPRPTLRSPIYLPQYKKLTFAPSGGEHADNVQFKTAAIPEQVLHWT